MRRWIAIEDRAPNSPSPKLGEVREGEAAFPCETIFARFPCWGRRNALSDLLGLLKTRARP
jgi:hypothetical protein